MPEVCGHSKNKTCSSENHCALSERQLELGVAEGRGRVVRKTTGQSHRQGALFSSLSVKLNLQNLNFLVKLSVSEP